MIDILSKLNDKQKEAVEHYAGPLLVVAGAGSGKTKALTHRIAYLIRNRGVSPANILAVTFTNKAAAEMGRRIEGLLEGGAVPTIGTFHSICVRILRKHIHELDYENSFVIYDDADQQILVKRIMKTLEIDDKKFNPKAILHSISSAKNILLSPEEFSSRAHDYFSEKVASVYFKYQEELKKNNALDFDDLLMKTVVLFRDFPKILQYFQEKFQFISVDEYQDTNHAQYILIRQLCEKYRNLCVIGDSDQSIYSWRGANMRNILDFEKDFPDAKVVFLEQNYRSTKNILKAAHNVIVKNRQRKEKNLWTNNAEGEALQIYEAFNERDEGVFIVERINKILMQYEHPDYGDFCVLYRTNAQSRVMEEIFLRYGIPYKIVGGIKFYSRKEIKDIVAYLKLLVNPHDSISLLRVINNPTRKIGAGTILQIQEFANRENISFFRALERCDEIDLSESKINDLKKFVRLIKELSVLAHTEKASAIIKYVTEETGYRKMLTDEGTVEAESRLENISELISVASKYDALEDGISLSIFLEEIALIADIDSLPESQNSVTLMTLHAAKGLEFKHVFIVGLEEGIFPHSRSKLEPEELEEERRLMYVGITRAEQSLSLIFAKQRMLYGEMQNNIPSQFLHDIPRDIAESNSPLFMSIDSGRAMSQDRIGRKLVPVESFDGFSGSEGFVGSGSSGSGSRDVLVLKDGDKVRHDHFGEGIVIQVIGGVATVAFADPAIGVKKLAISVAPLVKI